LGISCIRDTMIQNEDAIHVGVTSLPFGSC